MKRHNASALRAGGSRVTRERLELRGAGTPADEVLIAILVGANRAEPAILLLRPSGDPTPSVDDVGLIVPFRQAGSLMALKVLDHAILAETWYCSFKEMRHL